MPPEIPQQIPKEIAPQDQQPKSSIHLGALCITVLLLAVAIFVSFHTKISLMSAIHKATNNLHQIPGGALPPNMPADIVLAKDAKIISSYTATVGNQQTQSTLIYSTSKTPTSVISDYIKFLTKSGWSMILPGSAFSVRFSQANKKLSVSASQNNGLTVVSINLLNQNAQ
jgi:hypothetical protein